MVGRAGHPAGARSTAASCPAAFEWYDAFVGGGSPTAPERLDRLSSWRGSAARPGYVAALRRIVLAGAAMALPLAAGALVCPSVASAAAPVSAARAAGGPLPVAREAQSAAHLTLIKTVSRTATRVGTTLSYTVTVGNTGTSVATNVTVNDVLGGDAGYIVNDGTGGTANSFEGSVVVTVTKVNTGHYRWSYSTVPTGSKDIVSFTALITLPGAPPLRPSGTIVLTNTATVPGVPARTVTTTAAYRIGPPATGTNPNATPAGLLLLVGLGFIITGALARRPTRFAWGRVSGSAGARAISGAAPPPGRYR
jgi:uncharacterized repeat protein (TIGR01451 family)